MATKQADDFLAILKALADTDLASALAFDPDLIKKAQKAIIEAKRIESDAAKRKSELTAASAGVAYDAKSWAKAKKLVTGPFNEANSAEFGALMAKTDPNLSPEGEASLLAISMDYLSERSVVALDWPMSVFKSGAKTGYAELKSMCNLFDIRSQSDLGEKGRTMMVEVFCQEMDWAGIEASLVADKALQQSQDQNLLIEFLRRQLFGSHTNGANSKDPKAWEAMENMARSGVKPISLLIDKNSYRPSYRWEALAAISTQNDEAGQAKARAFDAFIGLGWCDVGVTAMTDGLANHASTGAGAASDNCGSRSVIGHLPLERASLDIFTMLCEREGEKGYSRYDSVGRSRLYFVNEKLRQSRANDPIQTKIILSMAEKAMELGDPPESVNPQNAVAKAANKLMADVIGAAIEKRELHGVVGSSGAGVRAKPRTL